MLIDFALRSYQSGKTPQQASASRLLGPSLEPCHATLTSHSRPWSASRREKGFRNNAPREPHWKHSHSLQCTAALQKWLHPWFVSNRKGKKKRQKEKKKANEQENEKKENANKKGKGQRQKAKSKGNGKQKKTNGKKKQEKATGQGKRKKGSGKKEKTNRKRKDKQKEH